MAKIYFLSITLLKVCINCCWRGLRGQEILLEYNTLKGVYQVMHQLLPSDWPICLVLNSGLTV